MPSSFLVINAPKTTTVTAAGLDSAIRAAQPGETVVVSTAGAPVALVFANLVKGGYGVCVQLPLDQVVSLDASAGTSNIHFFGGKFSSDVINGTTATGNNGLFVRAGCSKISVNGTYFDGNQNSIVCTEAFDILVDLCRMLRNRADHAQTITTSRMQMKRNAFDSSARGQSICYYPDGRSPAHSINSGVCAADGGTWEDSSHADLWQFRTGCSDVTATDNVSDAYTMVGFVDFGSAGPTPTTRVLIANNVINDGFSHGINVTGTDIEVRDNTVNLSPTAPIQPIIMVSRSSGGAVRGGRNIAQTFNNPSGVDLGGSTITGDVVVPPELPRIVFPAWAPTFALPAAIPLEPPVRITGGDGIRPSAVPEIGTWLTVNRGLWTGTKGISWEYRWTRNGTPIGGATSQIYQVVADDIGQSVGVEVRGTNASGVGSWYAYTPLVAGAVPTITGSFSASTSTPDAGDNVTFTMTLTSTAVGVYSFQLTKDGINISEATTNPYTVTNWQEADDGAYRMVVTDSGNSEVRTFGPVSVVVVISNPSPFQSVNTNGWSVVYSDPPTFNPIADPIGVVVSRQGFNASAAPVSVNDSIVCMKRLRLPWPDQATLTADQVSLSEYVYASDTIDGVVNNSTLSYPLPIAHWMRHDKEIINSATYTARLCVAHAYARNGRPVAAVEFSATDGTTTVTSLVNTMSTTVYSASGLTVPHFAGNLDFSGFANGATITISAIIYPWVGTAFNIATNADAYPSPNLTTLRVLNNRTGAFGTAYAYVDAAGPGATPTVSADPAVAEANPYGTLDAAATALRAFNNTTYSRNFCDGGVIRLLVGTHIFSDPIRTPGPTSAFPLTIEAANPAAVATTILRDRGTTMFSSVPDHLIAKNIRVQRSVTGSYACYDNAAANLDFNPVMVFEGCSFDANGAGSYAGYILRTGNMYFLNCTQVETFGQATRLGTNCKAVKTIGCNGDFARGVTGFAVIGSKCSGSTVLVLNSGAIAGVPATVGLLVAFSHLTQTNGGNNVVNGTPEINARGYAIVGCVLETPSGVTGPTATIHADTNPDLATNVVLTSNTLVGNRLNWMYNEAGTVTVQKSGFISMCAGNTLNTKADIFGENSNLVGGWSALHKVGSRANAWLRGSDQNDSIDVGSWLGEVRAPGEVFGTNAAPLNPDWLNDQSATASGSGGGDYTPGAGSELPTMTAAMAPHSHDQLGRPYVEGSRVGAINAV